MNNECGMYGKITSYMSNNFKISYYPTHVYINEVLEIIDETDVVKVNVILHDISMFMNMLSDDVEFNRCYMEILFMFIVNNDIVEDYVIDELISEFNCGVLESIVSKDKFIKYNHYINKETISFLLLKTYNIIRRNDSDLLIIGWLKGSNYTIGVMHV